MALHSPEKRHHLQACTFFFLLALTFCGSGHAQDAPYISGGGGFITSTKGGNTTYIPIVAPEFVASLGSHFLVESRANVVESYFPRGGGEPGYTQSSFLGLSYLQADVLASRNITLVGGEFLTPFGTYNERLTPIWVSNFEEAPLIFSIGTMGTGSSVGGMARGSAFSSDVAKVDYAVFFSASSSNEQFNAERSSGSRVSVFFPKTGAEMGFSYARLLQDKHENYAGVHLWWEPSESYFRFRSEYAHAPHAQGYWAEADYRLAHFGGEQSLFGRLGPVFRLQQTFRTLPDAEDGLPSANTQEVDFALDYNLPHEIRLNSSYSRELSSTGNRNIWQTGIVYRFLFPLWRSK